MRFGPETARDSRGRPLIFGVKSWHSNSEAREAILGYLRRHAHDDLWAEIRLLNKQIDRELYLQRMRHPQG